MGKSQLSAEREAGPGAQSFIRAHGWSAMGFPRWAGLINSTQKIRVLVKSAGVIIKGHIRGRHWEAGETVRHKGYWESHIRN